MRACKVADVSSLGKWALRVPRPSGDARERAEGKGRGNARLVKLSVSVPPSLLSRLRLAWKRERPRGEPDSEGDSGARPPSTDMFQSGLGEEK